MATIDGKKTGGRKKGVPNKTTTEVKEALVEAFEKMGGVPSLVAWGVENPTEFYKLWVKVMPTQVDDNSGKQAITISFGNMADND